MARYLKNNRAEIYNAEELYKLNKIQKQMEQTRYEYDQDAVDQALQDIKTNN